MQLPAKVLDVFLTIFCTGQNPNLEIPLLFCLWSSRSEQGCVSPLRLPELLVMRAAPFLTSCSVCLSYWVPAALILWFCMISKTWGKAMKDVWFLLSLSSYSYLWHSQVRIWRLPWDQRTRLDPWPQIQRFYRYFACMMQPAVTLQRTFLALHFAFWPQALQACCRASVCWQSIRTIRLWNISVQKVTALSSYWDSCRDGWGCCC